MSTGDWVARIDPPRTSDVNIRHFLYMNPAKHSVYTYAVIGLGIPSNDDILLFDLGKSYNKIELLDWLIEHREYLDAIRRSFYDDDLSLWLDTFQISLEMTLQENEWLFLKRKEEEDNSSKQ